MPPLSDDLHNVIFAVRFESVPDENDITVQGILEKSQTTAAAESMEARRETRIWH